MGRMVAAPSPASMRGLGIGFVLALGLGLGLGIESSAAPSPASMCGFWPLSASCLCLVPASMTSSTNSNDPVIAMIMLWIATSAAGFVATNAAVLRLLLVMTAITVDFISFVLSLSVAKKEDGEAEPEATKTRNSAMARKRERR